MYNCEVTMIAANLKVGDRVFVVERWDGDKIEMPYQYIISPRRERGLLRVTPLEDYIRFDEDGGSDFAQSSIKKVLDKWAVEQDFGDFVAEVSLLELPRNDGSEEAMKENYDYTLSLKLPKDFSFLWTKTSFLPKTALSPGISDVWQAGAYLPSCSVRHVNACHISGALSPVLWLKPNIRIGYGRGTREDPHRIMLG